VVEHRLLLVSAIGVCDLAQKIDPVDLARLRLSWAMLVRFGAHWKSDGRKGVEVTLDIADSR